MMYARNQRVVRGQSGWTLVALIVLLAVALIALAGVGSGVAEGLRAGLVRVNETKAAYLASAGILDAVRSYQTGDGGLAYALGEFPVVAPSEVFIRPLASPQRDFVLVDMSRARLDQVAGSSRLRDWTLRNVGPASPGPTLTTMVVDWTQAVPPDPSERVQAVLMLGGPCTLVWEGSQGPGEEIDIPDCQLSSNAMVGITQIWFTGTAVASRNPMVITVKFIMADAPTLNGCAGARPASEADPLLENCQRTAQFVKNGLNAGLFTIRSIGEVRESPFTTRRGVRAEFRATSNVPGVMPRNQIISWIDE
ncbi:MAG: hypothetical protein HYW10_05315 [Candidatus Omnitrophica bacterium]|nr:hypothetical protein [Candidatus Omnitrophota bacterium]